MRKHLPFVALGAMGLSALAACSAILGDFDVSTVDTTDSGAPDTSVQDTGVHEGGPMPDRVAPNEAGMCPNPGDVVCNNLCTNTQNDPQNCNGCNMPCGQGQACNGGKCTNGVLSMVAGTFHTCARVASGSVYCWGDNSMGQLGDGTTMARATATIVPKDEQNNAVVALDIAAGELHTCALYADGRVFCWGDGEYGQLGDGQRGFDGGTITKPVPGAIRGYLFTTLPAFRGLAHGEGANHACAAAGGDAGVWCWGDNTHGAAGQDPMNSQTECGGNALACEPYAKASNTLAAIQLGVGNAFSCGVVGGLVDCWGTDNYGQLGDGKHSFLSSFPNPQPTNKLGTGSVTVKDVAMGTSHACAALSDGSVWCWGYDGTSQLGHDNKAGLDGGDVNCSFDPGFYNPCSVPTQVAGIANAVAVGAGEGQSCAVKSDGTVWCWGNDTKGQLGNGMLSGTPVPAPVQAQLPNTATDPAVGVAAGSSHTCAWTRSGKAYCWGANDKGQLGNGMMTNSNVPVAVQGLP